MSAWGTGFVTRPQVARFVEGLRLTDEKKIVYFRLTQCYTARAVLNMRSTCREAVAAFTRQSPAMRCTVVRRVAAVRLSGRAYAPERTALQTTNQPSPCGATGG